MIAGGAMPGDWAGRDATCAFRSEFPFAAGTSDNHKIIVGQSPYKRVGHGTELVVAASGSEVEAYRQAGHVAFLVSRWIRFPHSLEAVYNVLFGRDHSQRAYDVLKEQQISPIRFADFLWREGKIALFNVCNDDRSPNDSIILRQICRAWTSAPGFGPDETAFCSLKMHGDSGATVGCGL